MYPVVHLSLSKHWFWQSMTVANGENCYISLQTDLTTALKIEEACYAQVKLYYSE